MSEDQITVFQRKDIKFQRPCLEQEPGEVSKPLSDDGRGLEGCSIDWEWGSPREQTEWCLPGHKLSNK